MVEVAFPTQITFCLLYLILAVIEDRIAFDTSHDFAFEVDHPFVFYVKSGSGVIFLMGRVVAA